MCVYISTICYKLKLFIDPGFICMYTQVDNISIYDSLYIEYMHIIVRLYTLREATGQFVVPMGQNIIKAKHD